MTQPGHSVQIVTKTHGSDAFNLDEQALEQILMKAEVKDLPVVVVSVPGPFRSGRSFLLNFFLRYLKAPPSDREDSSWLGNDSEPLNGFPWRGGSRRMTEGIVLWSEPFVVTQPSGIKVAVLLMDTQGTFDSTSTVRDCFTIFALSTLLSSVQIYNLHENIQDDDFENLQLFAECGKIMKAKGLKPFQTLEFLVRDWQFSWEDSYGIDGGESVLQQRLTITGLQDKTKQELRNNISSSFEKLSCFLMPHPGVKVIFPKFMGKISELTPEFKDNLKILVTSILTPEKLTPKTVNGKQIKVRDLLYVFKKYVNLFNNNTFPTPTTIVQAMTLGMSTLFIFNEARDIYEKGMDIVCGPREPSMLKVELEEVHRAYKTIARIYYMTKEKEGSKEDINIYYDKLLAELEDRLPQFLKSNETKTETAIKKAKESYVEAIKNITNEQPLCVDTNEVEKVHKEGLDAAARTFDAARRRTTNNNVDIEREVLLNSFQEHYKLLQQSNNSNVALKNLQYFACNAHPNFSRGSPK